MTVVLYHVKSVERVTAPNGGSTVYRTDLTPAQYGPAESGPQVGQVLRLNEDVDLEPKD